MCYNKNRINKKLGKLEVVATTEDGENVPIKYDVYDESNKIVKNTQKLRRSNAHRVEPIPLNLNIFERRPLNFAQGS